MTQTASVSVEKRLAAVEAALTELQKQVAMSPAKGDWVQQITGSFEDEPEFEVVLAYGRAIRQGDYSVLEPVDQS